MQVKVHEHGQVRNNNKDGEIFSSGSKKLYQRITECLFVCANPRPSPMGKDPATCWRKNRAHAGFLAVLLTMMMSQDT